MARYHIQNTVDVKKIMSEIREQIQQEKKTVNPWNSMFNREIDVAEVMRNLKNGSTGEESFAETADDFGTRFDEIYSEISRINDYVEGTRTLAIRYIQPGCIIPVNPSRPVWIQKIFTFCKRLVRKAAKFIVLDQMTFNTRINECIKALRESQEQSLKLVKMVDNG